MRTEDNLKKLWNQIDYHNGGSLQLEQHHLLEWHVSYVSENQKAVVIISRLCPKEFESSKSILIRISKRTDERYMMSLILTNRSQEQVFISMCANLIDYSANADTEQGALEKVSSRFHQWQKLLAYRHTALMSSKERKGLIGELIYLEKVILGGKDPELALNGWVGPEGADQDFVYDQSWYEIKTIGVSSTEVKISSVEQLGRNNERGSLIIERVDQCAPEAEGAFSLNAKVEEVLSLLKHHRGAAEGFVSKLNGLGYIRLDDYDRVFYKYSGESIYIVDNNFPRITRESLDQRIVNLEYVLSVPGLALNMAD